MPTRLFATLLTGALAVIALSQEVENPKIPTSYDVAPRLLPQVVVRFRGNANPTLFASVNGLRALHPLKSRSDTWVFSAPSVKAATASVIDLKTDSNVSSVFQDRILPLERCWAPNDPYFFYNAPEGHPGQWHLRNTANLGGANIDARVWGAWQRDITGQGVTIGICDDSFQTTHPDLAPGYSVADSYDFGQLDGNPDPVAGSDVHGISVAGVAGGRGGNGLGITGAAPLATLAGLRLPFSGGISASAWMDVLLYHSSGSTRTIQIKNHSYIIVQPYIEVPEERAALTESIEAGTIHVWAAGNNRGGPGEDSNKADSQSVPGQIAVAALGANGVYSYYSSFGANVAVTTPSGNENIGITTTDRMGSGGYNGHADSDYTTGFSGTSSAAPLAAGVLALVKQVQPALDGRFAKHLLAISSDVVDATDYSISSDSGWRVNAGGIRFNQNYGFGLINADRLTANAVNYKGVTPLVTEDTGTISTGLSIPDNNYTGVSRKFTLNSNTPLEEMVVTLNLSHTYAGDLRVYLISPSGYRSRLLVNSPYDGTEMNGSTWTASTNAFWGENPQGTWTITVQDIAQVDTGTFNSFRAVARMGTLVAKPALDASYVSETTPTFNPGERKSVKMRFKNTGTTTWTPAQIKLKATAATTTAWGVSTSSLRAETAPGGIAEFTFYVTAPTTEGSYPWRFQIQGPNGLIGTSSPDSSILVTGNRSEFVTQTGLKSTVKPGEKFNAYLTFKNIGSVTWKKGDGFALRSFSPINNTTWGLSKVLFNAEVAPGASVTVRVAATAPSTAGSYGFQWAMSRSNTAVFGQPSAPVTITVAP